MILSEFTDARVDTCEKCKKVIHGHPFTEEPYTFFCWDCSPEPRISCVACFRLMNAERVSRGLKPMSCGLFPWEVDMMNEKGIIPPADIEHWEWR